MSFDPEKLGNSPVEQVCFRGHDIYIKRDDLLGNQTGGDNQQFQAFNGNKARKLYYYLCNDFPGINRLVSYGSAQSNMLFSLSVLAKLKGWKLDFYVDHIAKNLRENPRGNYAEALTNGAEIHEAGALIKDREPLNQEPLNIEDYVQKYVLPELNKELNKELNEKWQTALFIPEGGRNDCSEFGLKLLAEELIGWIEKENLQNPKLMLPSGTGTTAFYLQKYLPFEVLTCACVGGAEYLQQQFRSLDQNEGCYPTILNAKPPSARSGGVNKKHHFGKLYPEFFEIWQELLEETGITFELLYDPLGWITMIEHLGRCEKELNMIYLHQGGLLGNNTMLQRYDRAQIF